MQTLEYLAEELTLTSLGIVNHQQPLIATNDQATMKQRPAKSAVKPAIKRV
ncbi:hypothetical protein [Lactiplantibacillus plantarum]|uniref:hypothetical protein n=1 Tax=Lactiplantibacillus plantarum TaxID=1590 RepID=UPI0020129A6F|nr:hypothetical protein [Lactiplantibacillus plantarum]